MGVIVAMSNFVAIASNNNIYLVSKKSSNLNVTTLELPALKKCQSEDTKSPCINSDVIVYLVASKGEKFITAATHDKRLITWNVLTSSVHKEELLVKRPMAVTFSPNSTTLVVADKNGDVYNYPLHAMNMDKDEQPNYEDSGIDVEPGPEPLLGHFSMLLDLTITDDGKFLITSDRDEKIRVSSFPNCYNIHTFCLGHTEFVSHIRLLPNRNDRLLSASGDGRIILWNYLKGEELSVLDLRDKIECLIRSHSNLENASEDQLKMNLSHTYISNVEVSSISLEKYIVAISFDRLPIVLFYEMDVSKDHFSYLYSQKLSFPPHDFLFLEGRELLVFMNTSLKNDLENPLEDEERSLEVLQFSEDFREIHILSEHYILNFGQTYKEKLKLKNVLTLDANSLFKHNKFDNVADYFKKKQERLSTTALPVKRKASEL